MMPKLLPRIFKKITFAVAVTVVIVLASQTSAADPQFSRQPPRPMELKAVRTWMYQIQELEEDGAIDRLARSDYDLLVVEPTATEKDSRDFDMAAMVRKLHAGRPGRIVLAYIDIGEAENYRTYWAKDWKAPTKKQHGEPVFLVTPDPDGWSGNFPVAFWDQRWQEIIAVGKESVVKQVMAAGFDGLYLDWIEAYEEPAVAGEAKKQNIQPAKAMVEFIRTIRDAARQIRPGALIVSQNAPYLIDEKGYLDLINAAAFEDTWFRGKADTPWGKPRGGDIPHAYRDESSTARRIEVYKKYQQAGKPVFTVDYCLKPENAKKVYEAAKQHGFVPLVTQVSLERITETPPPK